MYTRCPKCSTCFRVTDRHLAIAKGKVRCGQCQLVFNAPEHAIDDLPANSLSTKASEKAAPSITQAAPTLAKTKPKRPASPIQKNNVAETNSANTKKDNVKKVAKSANTKNTRAPMAKKPKIAPPLYKKDISPEENDKLDLSGTYTKTNASSLEDILNEMEGQLSLDMPSSKNHITNENEFDDEINPPEQDDAPANDKIIKNKVDFKNEMGSSEFENNIVSGNINLDLNETDIPIQLRNDIERLQTPPRRRLHPLLSFSFILILLGLSFSQIAYFRAHELIRLIPSSAPYLESYCEKIHCHYSGPRNLHQIQLISRDVRQHPKEKKALLITAAMINNAPFSQPYPKINIRLSDISGNVVAERVFNAKIYMGKLNSPFLLMKSKTPVHINFEVVDPGRDAINFEFKFL